MELCTHDLGTVCDYLQKIEDENKINSSFNNFKPLIDYPINFDAGIEKIIRFDDRL
jgi:hypothetical protein